MSDAFAVLGLAPDATIEQIRTARRNLAKHHHPDHGGDAAQMRIINEAADRALREVTEAVEPAAAPNPQSPQPPPPGREPWSGISRDIPSFTVDALAVETFEALLVVTSWIGEVLDDDPPHRLDVRLDDPTACWCRLDIVPDAGSSTVSLTVAGLDDVPAPEVLQVRDVWVANLNQIDWT